MEVNIPILKLFLERLSRLPGLAFLSAGVEAADQVDAVMDATEHQINDTRRAVGDVVNMGRDIGQGLAGSDEEEEEEEVAEEDEESGEDEYYEDDQQDEEEAT